MQRAVLVLPLAVVAPAAMADGTVPSDAVQSFVRLHVAR